MWFDYKLNNKLLIKLRDKLTYEYVHKNAKVSIPKVKNVLGCLLNNLSYSALMQREDIVVTFKEEYFSKPVIYNGVNTGRKLSYTYFKKVLDWLCEEGYAVLHKGGEVISYEDNQCKRSVSKLVFCKDIVDQVHMCYQARVDYPTVPDVLQVRDDNKKVIVKNLGRKEKKLVNLLTKYNFTTRKFKIEARGLLFDIQLRKVFNRGSFTKGGRSYVVGGGSAIMNTYFRSEITIDGKPTIELDFKALHPSMIAEMMGITFDEDFDPYGIELDGYDKKVLRKIAKLAFLALFNSSTFNEAMGAVSKWLRELTDVEDNHLPTQWKAEGLVPPVIEVKRILEELAEHNKYAMAWLLSDKGVDLQYLDSRIMDIIIQQFLDIDEFVLPVHDSVVVQYDLEDFTKNAMRVAYKMVLKTDNNCKIERK